MDRLFIISGLSGAGKDSVIETLKKTGLDFNLVITTTTRPMRSGENEGHPYHFVSEKEFKKLIQNNKLVEWAKVYDNYYGVQKRDIENLIKGYKPVILKIDYQGAKTIKSKFPKTKVIFILPPSLEILEKRLRVRGQDSKQVIQRRLKEAKNEIKNLDQWDYVIINEEGKLDETAEEVKKIILRGKK